ncbi:MAG: WG repeat-containing protein [Anaerolineae bacterium]|nr:WG repeat-containing protein [Anaerolineae bacterium]
MMRRSIKRAVISVIVLFSVYSLVTLAAPLPQNETRLFAYSADGQSYGYVDTTGEWAIEPEFDFAGDFVDGLAVVAQDGKYGYIDPTGAVVIEPAYDFAEDFSNGLAVVVVDGAFGYVDDTGQLVIDTQFDDAYPFAENGLAAAKEGALYGYIDTTGQFVIEPQFQSAFKFSEDLAAVVVDDQTGFIDDSGQMVIDPQFAYAGDFSEGLAVVVVGDQAGFIDNTGDLVIEPQFDYALDFSGDLAAVSINDRFGYINPEGDFVIEPQFAFAESFSEGLAAVSIDDYLGYIDDTGQMMIDPQYDQAGPFQDGLARVEKAFEWGVIDPKGEAQFTLPVTAVEPTETIVRSYLPGIPDEVREGICPELSVVVPNSSARRCLIAGNEIGEVSIFDPCLLASNGQTLVCGVDPIAGASGFQVSLLEPLPETDAPAGDEANQSGAWLLQLADGATCQYIYGATFTVNDQRVNYVCSDNSVLLGDLLPGTVWQGEQVDRADIEGEFDEGYTASQVNDAAISAVWQPVDPADLINEIGLAPDAVGTSIEGLAELVTPQLVPATPFSKDDNGEFIGEPAHLRFTFDNVDLPEWGGIYPDQAQLLIYPVEAYETMAEEAGVDTVSDRLDALRTLLADRPETIEDPIPVLADFGSAVQDLVAQVQYLDFNGGSGIRFITHYGVDDSPITDYDTFYTFQGLTDDGQYYIAFYNPASTALLPSDLAAIDTLLEDPAEFKENYQTYLKETTDALDQASPADFTPDLSQLDTMLESLQIGPTEN